MSKKHKKKRKKRPERPDPPIKGGTVALTRSNDTKGRKHAGTRKVLKCAVWILAGLIFAFAALTAVLCLASRPVTLDIGEPFSVPALENPVLSLFCTRDTDSTLPDTSYIHETTVPVRLYGFIPRDIPVSVRDLTPPVLKARTAEISTGAELLPEQCVLSAEDKTALTFFWEDTPDLGTPGSRTLRLTAEDEGGNRTVCEVPLSVLPEDSIPQAEFGTSEEAVRALAEQAYPGLTGYDYHALDCTVCGTYPVDAFRGEDFCRLLVRIADTVPPAARPVSLDIRTGQKIQAEDFAAEITDASAVTAAFSGSGEPDITSPGEQKVSVTLTDAQGNTAALEAALRVWDIPELWEAESGTSQPELEKALFRDMFSPDSRIAPPVFESGFDVSTLQPGDHEILLHGMYSDLPLTLRVRDTVAPKASAYPRDLLRGSTPQPEDFVRDIVDASPCTVRFLKEPDLSRAGEQTISVIVSDSFGNETRLLSSVTVWDVPAALTAEYGTTNAGFSKLLFASLAEKDRPAFTAGTNISALTPGEHTVSFVGKHEPLSVSVTVADTTAPKLVLRPVEVFIGKQPTAEQFVSSVQDLSGAEISFVKEPDVSRAHEEQVSIRACDGYGNAVEKSVSLRVVKDEIPPVIYGVETIYALEGETVSVRKNVSAFDNADGTVAVKADASKVDTKHTGTYPVTYTAVDSAGNKAVAEATVVIRSLDRVVLDESAQKILDQIITPGMTDRQKARAVYKWCSSSIRYSTSTSHLMGQFVPAAYSGITTKAGNCYVYYAVSSTMLTLCGIENQMIRRDSVDDPHYWNLVKVEGNWYHFDACPHHANCYIDSFLLTDKQVRDYSANVDPGYYSFDASLYPATP